MLKFIKKAWSLVPLRARGATLVYMPLSLISGLLELVGIATIWPFVAVATEPAIIESNPYLARTNEILGSPTQDNFLMCLAALLLIVLVIREVFIFSMIRYRAYLYGSIEKELSEDLLSNYLKRDFRFLLQRHSADLGQNVLVRSTKFMNDTFKPLVSLIGSGLGFLILAFSLIVLNPVLAAAAIFSFGSAQYLIYRRLGPKMFQMGRRTNQLDTSRFRTASEALQGIREAKLLGCENFYLESYAKQNEQTLALDLDKANIHHLPPILSRATLFAVVIGGVLVLFSSGAGATMVPQLTTYFILFSRILTKMQSLFTAATALRGEQSVVDELSRDLHASQDPVPPKNQTSQIAPKRDFGLKAVEFCYPQNERPTLKNITFTVTLGSTVVIVGESGAGKTTLLDVMSGLLAADSGELMVDSNTVARDDWHGFIGYVSQEVFLSDQSLAQNIAFGVPEESIDMKRVEGAARLACLDKLLSESHQNGHSRNLGERGDQLSRGQRQRVGIARALYRDPKVVILDEATSGLDPATEYQLLENLTRCEPAKTVILATHRLTNATNCDQLLVLHEGRVVGDGLFDDLRLNCPEFLNLMSISRGQL